MTSAHRGCSAGGRRTTRRRPVGRPRAEPVSAGFPADPADNLADQMAVGVGVVGVAGSRLPPRVGRRQRTGHPVPIPQVVVGQRLADGRHPGPVAQGMAQRRLALPPTANSGHTESIGSSRPMRPASTSCRASRPTRACRPNRSPPGCRAARGAAATRRPTRRPGRLPHDRRSSRTRQRRPRLGRRSCGRTPGGPNRTEGRTSR